MQFVTSRRQFLSGIAAVAATGLAGCAQTPRPAIVDNRFPVPPAPPPMPEPEPMSLEEPTIDAAVAAHYAGYVDEGYDLPAIPFTKVDPRFLRQAVVDPTGEAPGTIIVNTEEQFLYLVLPGGMAMRYGVGLGRQGYAWKGRAVVQWKRKWPTWTPPGTMIKRDPKLEKWRQGMPPGLKNPLGARALYIFKDGQDTLYRIHGSPEWKSIGTSASSGCVRMFNQDVIDLYERVNGKATLVVV